MSVCRNFSVLFTATVLLVGCDYAEASVYNEYRFDNEDYLSAASDFTPWAKTLSNHYRQRQLLYSCAPNTTGEVDKKNCRGRLKSFFRIIQKAQNLTRQEQIQLVNFYLNRTRHDDDRPQRHTLPSGTKGPVVRNHWMTLHDFLIKGGDCEDYATAKYFMLRELGFAAQDMRVVVAYERRLRSYHAVLALRQENGDVWLLETDNRINKKSHRGYRYVYALNENKVWDHRKSD